MGELTRREVDQLLIGYRFDFRSNQLQPEFEPNPQAGKEYRFRAYRPAGRGGPAVAMADVQAVMTEAQASEATRE
ncbi:hypothetical protein [Deinococcus sp.]|uniref:hypothetical protein n=1 Tax=Deinococcus sp. TaxID=47478 RepID=UPI003C7AFB51